MMKLFQKPAQTVIAKQISAPINKRQLNTGNSTLDVMAAGAGVAGAVVVACASVVGGGIAVTGCALSFYAGRRYERFKQNQMKNPVTLEKDPEAPAYRLSNPFA